MADGLAAAGLVDAGFSAFMKSAKFRWLTSNASKQFRTAVIVGMFSPTKARAVASEIIAALKAQQSAARGVNA
jgi:hypothetical protein